MSTFGGAMVEFPDIRVDYFRTINGRRPPLACFLSHVHSDHLAGLDNLKSPFVYCSPATKEILLRLETYSHRLNFATGLLEARKQQYKHLKNILKPLPLETPTLIELEPGNEIQVTLFDANHCTGAVMFLIEGQGRAILYTGDIRSEPWFVNNLKRNPFMIEYTSGLKTLDCIYLDTSNLTPIEFPTKAVGLAELLKKVAAYPKNTVFHLSSWTFGYEEVWMALSRTLRSRIHVDKYKLRLYQPLRGEFSDGSSHLAQEAPTLVGFKCGNNFQRGCLTSDMNVRIHSCEKGMQCDFIKNHNEVVLIRPIITRTKLGAEIAEIGIGGGGGDLTQSPELELDSDVVIEQLLGLFTNVDVTMLAEIRKVLLAGFHSKRQTVSLSDLDLNENDEALPLSKLTEAFVQSVLHKNNSIPKPEDSPEEGEEQSLPRVITFPYSRHSSYTELCHLVKAFDPKDIYPCTVDEARWHEGVSMETLFGPSCSVKSFRHDMEMRQIHAERLRQDASSSLVLTQISSSEMSQSILPANSPVLDRSPEKGDPPLSGLSYRSSEHNSVHGPDCKDPSMQNGMCQCCENLLETKEIRTKEIAGTEPGLVPIDIVSDGNRRDSARRMSTSAMLMEQASKDVQEHLGLLMDAGFVNLESIVFAPSQVIRHITGCSQATVLNMKSSARVRLDALAEGAADSTKSRTTTPPQEHVVRSPGSASQNLRRKFIADSLEGLRTKRPRLEEVEPSITTELGASRPTSKFSSIEFSSTDSRGLQLPLSLQKADEAEEDLSYQEHQGCMPYFDGFDGVHRCAECDQELWMRNGNCTFCEAGEPAYFEILNPDQAVHMRLAKNEYDSETESPEHVQLELAQDYLDYQSSAYDTQDSRASSFVAETYEINSFIDDESIEDPESENDSGSEAENSETLYQIQAEQVSAELNALRADHARLVINHEKLVGEHEELRRDLLGSDSGSEGDGSLDEEGGKIVEVAVPEPVIEEIVLPETQEESLDPVADDEVRNREVAFESASRQDWNISLISTGDNHTYEEMIL